MNNIAKNNPQISILIPCYNEERNIEECLKHLIRQTYLKDKMEILVVDGMSTDGTRNIVNRYSLLVNRESEIENRESGVGNLTTPVIRLIDNPKGHRASALNIGIREARGNVIIRVDARTVIPEDYIEKCVQTLIEIGADNVGGMQKPFIRESLIVNCKSLTQMTIGMALSHPFGVGDAQFRLGKKSGYVDTVYLGCFRKEIFDKVGLFDEESAVISEDADMNYRIRKAGGKVYFNKDIVAYYYPRDNFKDLWKLYFRYGGAKAGNFLKRGSLTAWRQLVPPSFLLSLLVLPILGAISDMFLLLWVSVVGVYLIANSGASLHAALNSRELDTSEGNIRLSVKDRSGIFFRLLLVFPIMHLSWAGGFWRRLLQRPKHGEYWGY